MCATYAISGTSGRDTFQLVEIIERSLDILYFLQRNYSKLLIQISDNIIIFICGYVTYVTYERSDTH